MDSVHQGVATKDNCKEKCLAADYRYVTEYLKLVKSTWTYTELIKSMKHLLWEAATVTVPVPRCHSFDWGETGEGVCR